MSLGPGEGHALLLLNVKCLAEEAGTIKAETAAALGWGKERRGSWLRLLFLSSAQVSAVLPVFLATGVERGPACWRFEQGKRGGCVRREFVYSMHVCVTTTSAPQAGFRCTNNL